MFFLILQGIYHGSTIVPLLCLIIRVPPSSHLEKHHGSGGPILMVILCYTEGHVYTYYIYVYTDIYIYIILQNPLFFWVARKNMLFQNNPFFFSQGIWLQEITGNLREIIGKLRANYG